MGLEIVIKDGKHWLVVDAEDGGPSALIDLEDSRRGPMVQEALDAVASALERTEGSR